MAGKEAYKDITIPLSLYKKMELMIRDSEFASVSDYVVFVLKELVDEDKPAPSGLSDEDEGKVKDRLRALGYME